MDGIVDHLKVIDSMVFEAGVMPAADKNGQLIQSQQLKSVYTKEFKKLVEEGVILRYYMFSQISSVPGYEEHDAHVNEQRRKEVDRLNQEYYNRERHIKLKQCM